MTYQRDPLSVRFDRQAAAALSLAIAQHGKWESNPKLVPYVRVRGPAPLPGDLLRDDSPAHLSVTERAFQRSLYYDARIHQMTQRHKPDAVWSLKLEWDPVPVLPTASRNVRLRVFSDTEGARYAKRLPKRRKFSETESLQSGGVGSNRQRFA